MDGVQLVATNPDLPFTCQLDVQCQQMALLTRTMMWPRYPTSHYQRSLQTDTSAGPTAPFSVGDEIGFGDTK